MPTRGTQQKLTRYVSSRSKSKPTASRAPVPASDSDRGSDSSDFEAVKFEHRAQKQTRKSSPISVSSSDSLAQGKPLISASLLESIGRLICLLKHNLVGTLEREPHQVLTSRLAPRPHQMIPKMSLFLGPFVVNVGLARAARRTPRTIARVHFGPPSAGSCSGATSRLHPRKIFSRN